ncbi:MAG: NADH-quinone oxidoreductase subunit L [Sphingomonadales bacterium]
MLYQAIVFLPLAAAIIAGFGRDVLGVRGAQLVTAGAVTASALLSVPVFLDIAIGDGDAVKVQVLQWIVSGDLDVAWSLRIDALTAVMLVVVNGVSALVHWYSIGYMSHDPHPQRFMAYLSLFTFAMLMLVTADNFVQMFFGWEGVGLASYLLIGFWYKKPSANAAAIKAFVVNRIGDFGFSLGIFAIFAVFGTLNFDAVFGAAAGQAGQSVGFLGWQVDTLTLICLLLFIGAMGKSAQLGLHTWLPDAMEGPTPVSALIHAATMVTAGVFMVARCSPLFEHAPLALDVVAIVGATTALFAASVGLVQNDIKRVIAYSTCSQLGYMFFALGVGAYGAGIFHLFTHAFFKALLFLGAGSVIHALHDEQDMRRMGALRKKIPWTFAVMLIGTLAITGFPGFAGYYSKDAVLESAYAAHTGVGNYAFLMGITAALFTAFYSWRLIFMTFFGSPRGDHHAHDHAHESPPVMLVPLLILAIGAIVAGFGFYEYFVGHERGHFWGGALTVLGHDVLDDIHHVPALIKYLPFMMGIVGFLIAFAFYIWKPGLPAAFAEQARFIYRFLLNKWYFDELFNAIFVRPALWLGKLFWKGGDGRVIDGFGPDGVAAAVAAAANRARRLQSGYLYHYAFAMLIGVALAVTWFMTRQAGG